MKQLSLIIILFSILFYANADFHRVYRNSNLLIKNGILQEKKLLNINSYNQFCNLKDEVKLNVQNDNSEVSFLAIGDWVFEFFLD